MDAFTAVALKAVFEVLLSEGVVIEVRSRRCRPLLTLTRELKLSLTVEMLRAERMSHKTLKTLASLIVQLGTCKLTHCLRGAAASHKVWDCAGGESHGCPLTL